MIILPEENLHPHHAMLIETEEKRKKARLEQERKYKEANVKLNKAFYRHQPVYSQFDEIVSPSSDVALKMMDTFINEVHNPSFQVIMEEEIKKKSHCNVPSYSSNTSSSTDYSSSYSDSSNSSCDSNSCSSSSSCD